MNKYKNILPYHNTLPKFNGGGILSGQSTKYSQNKKKAEELDTDGDGVIGVNELKTINPNFDITKVPGHELFDFTSWFDPTPISDWTNASAYAKEGDYTNASVYAAMGLLPSFLGKVAKKPLKKIASKILKNNAIENTVKQNVKQVIPDWSKGVTHYGKAGPEAIQDALKNLKFQGKYLDEIGFDASTLINKNIVFHGPKHGRTIVEVALPNGKTQLFYKSSGLAGKSGKGAAGTTEGLWQPYGGHASTSKTDNWFIKDAGYEDYYGSKSFKDIADQLDRIALEEGWDMSGQILKSQRKSGGEDDNKLVDYIKKGTEKIKNIANWRENLAENLMPFGYGNIKERLINTVVNDKPEPGSETDTGTHRQYWDPEQKKYVYVEYDAHEKERLDLLNILLKRPQVYNTISESQYRPTKSKNKNAVYYSSKQTEEELRERFKEGYVGMGITGHTTGTVLGKYTIDHGKDEDGREYISYYDKWNLNPTQGLIPDKAIDLTLGLNSPEIYGRLYLDELEFGGERTTALRNFMYDEERNKLFKADDGGGFGSWLKGKWDANKDKIQKYADYASYVPVVGKAAGFVSAGIDAYDAYQAYQAGDMDTYRKERNKALTTAAFSGTPGQYVKGAIKSGIKQVAPQVATKTAAHVTKTGVKDGTKELQDVTAEENPIIDSPIPTGANVKDPREIASTGIEIDETKQFAIDQKTKEILNQIENDWDMKTQANRNNVTSKTNMPGVIQFVESPPTFSELSNLSESEALGLGYVTSPFEYKYYINKNKNSDINKKYVNNISINNDISKIENFRIQQSLMTDGYYGKNNWDNYNFAQHNDVVKLQKELVNNGYDIGNSNDEVVNRTVEERYKNKGVDAKFGPKTLKAWSDFELNKLNIKDKNILTASYYNDLIGSKDINWKFNAYNSKNKKFNYNKETTYDQNERMSYIESVDGIMSPDDYQNTEDLLNFMDNAIPEIAKDMLVQVDHNWVTTTVLSMIKEKIPVDLGKIDPTVLEYFDINDFNIKDDPKKLALATAYNIISNYSKIKEHLQDENVSEDQIRNASTFGLGKKYENKRPNQYFDQEVLEHQLMTAENLRTLLQNETVTNRNKILSNDMSQEIFSNETNALSIAQGDIDKMIKQPENVKESSLGGEIKKPKYTGKYARYGYEFDSEWAAKKEYENGGDIDLNIEKKLLKKGWIKPRKHKRFKMSVLPTHIILNSLDLKFMKKGGDYPDMETKIKIYDDYLNGVFDNMDNQNHKKKAKKIVDKLNRFYMYEARDDGQHVFDYMKSQLDKLKNK